MTNHWDVIEDALEDAMQSAQYDNDDDEANRFDAALAFVRQMREGVQPDEAWIPVGESLPGDHAWVLVYADGAINCMGYTPGKGFEDWVLQQAPNVVIQEITHWRHLPDSPIAT